MRAGSKPPMPSPAWTPSRRPPACWAFPTEFTPRVRDAIMGLMSEVDSLRRELVHPPASGWTRWKRPPTRTACCRLLNRRAFVRELTRYIAFAGRYNTPAALIYFDLNYLKKTNDELGHAAGDAVLVAFRRCAAGACARFSDCVGRLGGDEFGVLLSHANQDQALKKADALAQALEKAQPTLWNGHAIPVSFAYGAFELKSGDNPDTAMARADQAMYAQKKSQRAAAE